MAFTVDFDVQRQIIRVTVIGEFTAKVLMQLASVVSKNVMQYHCLRILNDLRQAEFSKGTFDIYSMPEMAQKAGICRQLKRALLVNHHAKDVDFLETVFLNQGHVVKVFTSTTAAEKWLLMDPKSYELLQEKITPTAERRLSGR